METQKANYFVRHWHGELPLSVSFWGNVVFVNILVTFLSNVVYMGGFVDGIRWQSLQLLGAGLIVFAIVVGLWQIVGTWRSASRYRRNGGSMIINGIVKFLMALGLLSLMTNVVTVVRDHIARYENAQLQNFNVYVSDSGETLFIEGEIGVTISDSVLALLDQHDAITTLALSGPGGDLNETFRILNALADYRREDRQLTTYAQGDCASACSILFMGGDHRVLAQGAQLGFHQLQAYVAVDDSNIERLQEKVARFFLRKGVSANFIGNMYQAAPDDMWYPDVTTLLDANVVHEIERAEDSGGKAITKSASLDVLALIKRNAPDRYATFEAQLTNLPQDDNLAQNTTLLTQNFIAELKIEAIRRLDDALLMQVILSEVQMYKTLAEYAPELCMQTLYPNVYGFPDYPSVMRYQNEAAFEAELTQIFENGLANDFPTIDFTRAQDDLNTVIAAMPGDIEKLNDYDDSIAGYREHCQAIAAFYAHIDTSLERDNAANLVRYLLEP